MVLTTAEEPLPTSSSVDKKDQLVHPPSAPPAIPNVMTLQPSSSFCNRSTTGRRDTIIKRISTQKRLSGLSESRNLAPVIPANESDRPPEQYIQSVISQESLSSPRFPAHGQDRLESKMQQRSKVMPISSNKPMTPQTLPSSNLSSPASSRSLTAAPATRHHHYPEELQSPSDQHEFRARIVRAASLRRIGAHAPRTTSFRNSFAVSPPGQTTTQAHSPVSIPSLRKFTEVMSKSGRSNSQALHGTSPASSTRSAADIVDQEPSAEQRLNKSLVSLKSNLQLVPDSDSVKHAPLPENNNDQDDIQVQEPDHNLAGSSITNTDEFDDLCDLCSVSSCENLDIADKDLDKVNLSQSSSIASSARDSLNRPQINDQQTARIPYAPCSECIALADIVEQLEKDNQRLRNEVLNQAKFLHLSSSATLDSHSTKSKKKWYGSSSISEKDRMREEIYQLKQVNQFLFSRWCESEEKQKDFIKFLMSSAPLQLHSLPLNGSKM